MNPRAPLWLRFLWTPDRQEIAVDDELFAHPQRTATAPTHDVAHLLAAASGLTWKPQGTRDKVCIAEFHAVLIEHLCVGVFDSVHVTSVGQEHSLKRALEHSHWFVEEHYAPFPVTFDAAIAAVRRHLDVEPLVRLAPIFFGLRAFELQHADFRSSTIGARFASTFRPHVDSISLQPQRELAQHLGSFARRF